MKELTQTHGDNCWQTAVACVLDIDPERLPDQHAIEQGAKDEQLYAGHHSYSNALNAFLAKHYQLAYLQEPRWKMLGLLRGDYTDYHFLIGPTVRTVETGGKRIFHVVVGQSGQMVWDPHPSKAGLIRSTSFGWLASIASVEPGDNEYGYGWHWTNPAVREHNLLSWQHRGKGKLDPIVSALCCCPTCFVDGEYQEGMGWAAGPGAPRP